jgi:hypothetical protein
VDEKKETLLNREFNIAGVNLNGMQIGGSILVASVLAFGIYKKVNN